MKRNTVEEVVETEFHEGCVAWVVIKDHARDSGRDTAWEGRPWDVPTEYYKKRVIDKQLYYATEELWLLI